MASGSKQIQTQVQKLSPQQILKANIMQLTNSLLEQRIVKELEDNPTLEIVDPIDEDDENQNQTENNQEIDTEFDWDELDSDSDRFELVKPNTESTDFIFTNHSTPKTLNDRIKDQLIDINISEQYMNIAYEIIGNIDDDGYFKIEPILIADRLGVSEIEVRSVLDIIKSLDPKGIASKDLKECISLQINKKKYPLAYNIIQNCYEDFIAKRYEKISKNLNCSMIELKDSLEIIKKINPKPGDGLPAGDNEFIIPDIIVEKRDNNWVIQMNDQSMYELRVSKEYSKMLDRKGLDRAAKKFIKDKTESANWFIDAIKHRKRTMLEIMNVIIQKQETMFRDEKFELCPMILKDIADELNIDISTVSRASNGKYVQLPWGIFEIRDFFSESIKTKSGKEVSNTVVKNRIKDIIENEDKSNPYDDQSIVSILESENYIVARRTVSKYRSLMGIAKSKLRREITDE